MKVAISFLGGGGEGGGVRGSRNLGVSSASFNDQLPRTAKT